MQCQLKLLGIGMITFAVTACSPGSFPWASMPPTATAPVVAPAEAEDVETVVSQLERVWVTAIVKKDVATIEWLLSEDFTGTSPTAHTYTKEMATQDLKDGSYVVTAMELDEISVNHYGNVAVAFTSQNETSSYNGKNMSGHYHFTDVWVKQNGQWQAVASHGTRDDERHDAD